MTIESTQILTDKQRVTLCEKLGIEPKINIGTLAKIQQAPWDVYPTGLALMDAYEKVLAENAYVRWFRTTHDNKRKTWYTNIAYTTDGGLDRNTDAVWPRPKYKTKQAAMEGALWAFMEDAK
jgi:hypothetical protein